MPNAANKEGKHEFWLGNEVNAWFAFVRILLPASSLPAGKFEANMSLALVAGAHILPTNRGPVFRCVATCCKNGGRWCTCRAQKAE
jgi:hypothetical protein